VRREARHRVPVVERKTIFSTEVLPQSTAFEVFRCKALLAIALGIRIAVVDAEQKRIKGGPGACAGQGTGRNNQRRGAHAQIVALRRLAGDSGDLQRLIEQFHPMPHGGAAATLQVRDAADVGAQDALGLERLQVAQLAVAQLLGELGLKHAVGAR
jgi:hypothetical protein